MSSTSRQPTAAAEFDFAAFSSGPGGSSPAAGDVDIARLLLSIWKPLILGGCLGGLLGIGIYLALGPVYRAQTQIMVSQKATIPHRDAIINRFGDRGDHVELIQSDLILQPAFERHGLNQISVLFDDRDPLDALREKLVVKRISGHENSFDNVLELAVDHVDPQIAKTAVQAIVDAYRDYLDEIRAKNSQQLANNLEGRREELDAEIAQLEQEYRNFRTNAPVYFRSSSNPELEGESRFEAELTTAEHELSLNQLQQGGIKARLTELQRRRERGDSQEDLEKWVNYLLSNPVSGTLVGVQSNANRDEPPAKKALDQQFMETRLLEQRLLHTLQADHTAVRNARREIDSLLEAYALHGFTPPAYSRNNKPTQGTAEVQLDLVSSYQKLLEGHLAELEALATHLEEIRFEAERKVRDAELSLVENQRLKDAIALKKSELKGIFDQLAIYHVSREQEGYHLRQISQVRVERSLKRLIKMVGALSAMGFGLVFVLCYYLEWADTRVKSIEQLHRVTHAQVLGVIPDFTSRPGHARLVRELGAAAALVFHWRPASREAEAFRTLRTTLMHSLQPGEKLVQITSSEAGDGKSTITANLGLAFAHAGKKVLLVDGDLRRSSIQALFKINAEPGLSETLQGELDWRNAVQPAQVDGMHLLVAGHRPDNPAELLSQASFGRFLQEAQAEYDLILIDSPPVLAVSDSCIIAPLVSRTVLISRLNKNKRAQLLRCVETLETHGGRIVGVIANGVDTQVAEEAGYESRENDAYYQSSSSRPPLPSRPTTLTT